MTTDQLLRQRINARFTAAGVEVANIEIRTFPGEVIAIVEVSGNYDKALELAAELDSEIEDGFITVRQTPTSGRKKSPPVQNVHAAAVNTVVELLNSRARASESQPSLRYVPDVAERINVAVAPRHHLVFGRRGVGKTALLLEAKRKLTLQNAFTLWVNLHPLRSLGKDDAFLTIAGRICDIGMGAIDRSTSNSAGDTLLSSLRNLISEEQSARPLDPSRVAAIVPKLQLALSRLCVATGRPLYLFLDDVHYLRSSEVPGLLDLLHGISRDNPVWLKVAGIRHQTKWFTPNPPVGLQTGHDAEIINLDITLEQPARARSFLQSIMVSYAEEAAALPLPHYLGGSAIDRLVLASGGVPRDFLSLCASAIQIARQRPNARTVGVQDVNYAAGSAAQIKLQELEDDAAAARGGSQAYIESLNIVRNFLLDDCQITFLRIDFMDKEGHPEQYALMQALMDLRMLHLVNASLSDPHHAGRRSEVYLMDLSQYSGARLKQKLQVLDFVRDHLVLKRTRSKDRVRIGDTPRKLVELLRRGPLFELNRLASVNRGTQVSLPLPSTE